MNVLLMIILLMNVLLIDSRFYDSVVIFGCHQNMVRMKFFVD